MKRILVIALALTINPVLHPNCFASSPRFALVANYDESTVSAYAADAVRGMWRATGYAVTGTNPTAVAMRPSSNLAYVANYTGNSISGFWLSSQGRLTPVPGFPLYLGAGSAPRALAIDPYGRFLYVAKFGTHSIAAYAINPTSGSLTVIAGAQLSTGTNPCSMVIDRYSKFLYVANYGSNNVSAYKIGSGGTLTSIGIYGAGYHPSAVAMDPLARFVYAANSGANSISAYKLNATTGTLTLVGTYAAGSNPQALAAHPQSKYLYAANYGSNNISGYSINQTTGALAPLSTLTFAAGTNPTAIAADSSGAQVEAVSAGGRSMSIYTVNSTTGSLTHFRDIRTRGQGRALAISSGNALSFIPTFLYGGFTTYDNSFNGGYVFAYSINPTSGLLQSVAGARQDTPQLPERIAIDPFGGFLFSAEATCCNPDGTSGNGPGSVAGYTLNSTTGMIEPRVSVPGLIAKHYSIAVDPSGRFLYTIDLSSTGSIRVFRINRINASASSIGTNSWAEGQNPVHAIVDPTGKFLVVALAALPGVQAFVINPSNGTLTPALPPMVLAQKPLQLTIDASGRFIYLTLAGQNTITALRLNGATGALTPIAGSPYVMDSPAAGVLASDPYGRFLYVGKTGASGVAIFAIDKWTGALTPRASGGAWYWFMATDFSGKFLYGSDNMGDIDSWGIDQTSGLMTYVDGFCIYDSPFSPVIVTAGRLQ